jgi:arylsulfatase A-like enzyme
MLQEVFRDAGWRTAGFWSGPNLHPWFGFGRGFERYVDCSTAEVADPEVFAVAPDAEAAAFDAVRDLHDGSHEGVTGPALVASFEEWLGGVPPDEPFFAFVHMWDVHYDYTPPPEHDLFDPGYEGPIDGTGISDLMLPNPVDPADLLHLIALYDGEIHATDHHVGRMLAALERAGRLEDTLVVFTADHGEEFLEHRGLGHKNHLYEEVLRVPLLLRLPESLPAGRVVDEVVSIVDIAPTILDLCALPAPEGVWGRSLAPLARGTGELEPRPAPAELTWRRFGVSQRAARGEGYKVYRTGSGKPLEVYDLVRDPREERHGLERELSPEDERLRAARALWSDVDLRAEDARTLTGGELPGDLEAALEHTGYLGGERPSNLQGAGDDL